MRALASVLSRAPTLNPRHAVIKNDRASTDRTLDTETGSDLTENPYLRSGLASLSDLETNVHRALYAALNQTQNEFLSKQELFRSRDYVWPADALHNWSRIWEYPYVYAHL